MRSRHDATVSYVSLQGTLSIPARANAIVVFAHGGGSWRLNYRNQQTAKALQQAGIATLLFNLLTYGEQADDSVTAGYRFDVPLLARRLAGTLAWLREQHDASTLSIGLFGVSTGAAAALVASGNLPEVRAIVSRGGRPDLAREALSLVTAPTLMIVGEFDEEAIRLNRGAAEQMACVRDIEIVRGATHLFEEPGTLETAERLAVQWFASHLAPSRED